MSQPAIAVQDVRRVSSPPISLSRQANQLLGIRSVRQEPLPGKPASSQRLRLDDGKTVIATLRKYPNREDPECQILESFTAHKVPAPQLLAKHDSGLFLQQDLRGPSLAQKLIMTDRADYAATVLPALKSLVKLHRVGSHDGFESKLPLIGNTEEWRREFIHYPAKLGATLDVKPSAPDVNQLMSLFQVQRPRFIKWNARPTTTRVMGDQVYWTDWERAAVRQRMDDLVWFLGDETLPDYADEELRLLQAFLPYFADGMSDDDAREYFYAFGALHISVRLGVLLRNKKQTEWLTAVEAAKNPELGLHKPWVLNLCRRGGRWAEQGASTAPLRPWFDQLKKKINTMP